MRIYVASSWRNAEQPGVVGALRAAGHEVYDFRNPKPVDHSFSWSEIAPDRQTWTPEEYVDALSDPIVQAGFDADFAAMQWAEALVYLLPCGRSASLEAGWAAGAGKLTIALLGDGQPELMVKLLDYVCLDIKEVLTCLEFPVSSERRCP